MLEEHSAQLRSEVLVPRRGIELPQSTLAAFLALAETLDYELVDTRDSDGPRYLFERANLVSAGVRVEGQFETGGRLSEFVVSDGIREVFRQELRKQSLDEVVISSVQVNRMRMGHEIEVHSHATMELAAVMMLQRAEAGGVHFTCRDMRQRDLVLHDLPEGGMIMNPGETFHGVTKIEQGGPRVAIVWSVNRLYGL